MPQTTVSLKQKTQRQLLVLRQKKAAMAASTNRNFLLLFFYYWLPVLVYAIIIYSFSSVPGKQIPYVFKFQSEVFHILEYAGFAVVLHRALAAQFPAFTSSRRFFWVVFLVVAYGITDEIHQLYVPNRYGTIIDVTYDGIGALLSNLFYRWQR